jgi:hypothetical protein
MTERRRNEKEEEKRGEKQDEKRGGWDEKWRRDRVNALFWVAMLVWGAVVLLIGTSSNASEVWVQHGWSIFLIGAGTLIFLTSLYRWMFPAQRRSMLGGFILALVFIGVGTGDLVSWSDNIIWVVVLLVIALGILLSAFRRR